jgi:methyl acetate hydrolase
MKAQADKVLKEAVDRGDVPGVVAVATDAKGVTYEGSFGKRVLGQPADMTPDTVVWIASMTKALTGAAAMQLVERGKLALDAPAKTTIPYLGEVGVLEGFDADGKPRTRKPRRDITLRHLLTHTAGFVYDIWHAEIGKYQEVMGVPGVIGCEDKSLALPLLFDPGERWDYGINIDWAGKMVEAVSGKKLFSISATICWGRSAWTARPSSSRPGCATVWRSSTIAAPTARWCLTWLSRFSSSPSSRWAAAGSTARPRIISSSCA